MKLPPSLHLADHPALDFLNTMATPKNTPVDWIGDGTSFLAWLVEARFLAPEVASSLPGGRRLDGLAREAVELREWFRSLLVRLKSKPVRPSPNDLARLNELLLLRPSVSQLEIGEDGKVQVVQRPAGAPPDNPRALLLTPIAEAIADLLSRADLQLVARCENPACTLWFFDRTRSHRRRWCSTALCGNRAKVAAFRERRRMKEGAGHHE